MCVTHNTDHRLLCCVFHLKSLQNLENRNISYKKDSELRVEICKHCDCLFRDDMNLKKIELNLKGFFDCCSSLRDRFPKFLVFMITSVVVVEVFYYNPLWNLKEYKRFHRRVKNGTAFM